MFCYALSVCGAIAATVNPQQLQDQKIIDTIGPYGDMVAVGADGDKYLPQITAAFGGGPTYFSALQLDLLFQKEETIWKRRSLENGKG